MLLDGGRNGISFFEKKLYYNFYSQNSTDYNSINCICFLEFSTGVLLLQIDRFLLKAIAKVKFVVSEGTAIL